MSLTEEMLSVLDEQMHQARDARLAKGWASPYSRNNPIASDIHDCPRTQIFALRAWRERHIPPPHAQEIIEEGNHQERLVIDQLRLEGWEIVEEQVRFEIFGTVNNKRTKILTGRADGKLRKADWPPKLIVPFDVKSTSTYRYEAIHRWQDLLKDVWLRKWWRQMQAYMIGEEYEHSLLILSNCRGGRKIIHVPIDWKEAERILKLCEWTMAWNAYFEENGPRNVELLDAALTDHGVAYWDDFSICQKCDWKDRLCHPKEPATEEGVPIRDWLKPDIDRHQELKKDAAEYRKLDAKLQTESRDNEQILVGKWVLGGKQTANGWRKSIRRVGDRV